MEDLHEQELAQHTEQQEVAEETKALPNEEVEEVQPAENPVQEEEQPLVEEPVQETETASLPTEEPIETPATEENLQSEMPVQEAETETFSDDYYDHLNKEDVVKTLEEVVANPDIVKIKTQISLLKIRFLQLNKEDKEQHFQAFLSEGGNKEDYAYEADPLEERFNKAFEKYKANKMRYAEELEQAKLANLAKKTALLEELKTLVDSSESLKNIYDRFNEVQNAWKEIGAVPQANVGELWQNYHFYVERFFDKIRINRELRDLDFKKNLETKLEICEKTEALILEPSIMRSFKLLQQYHQEWKDSGAVEEAKKEELWNRFKTASDKINQVRKEYYEKLEQQQLENYKAKLAICEKVEEITSAQLVSMKQANEISAAVNELFKTWRTLGPAPKDLHDAIWERFRKSMEDFFTTKKQFLAQTNEEQVNNYNLKVNLCMQAEAIALRQDWKRATNELLDLQQQWKNIGAVAFKHSETLWLRFRKACDDFFAAKTAYFENRDKHEMDNLAKKESLLKEIAEFQFGESREDNFNTLKEFQRRWTEIGHTPQADRDRLWDAYRIAIDEKFEKLKSLPNLEDKTKYAQRISEMLEKKTTDAGRFIAKEAGILQDKIRQLTDQVNLWENNLGFFANSKNSDVLREQFNKKIANAREEISALKEKLMLIREKKN